jgi:hypothetical protein
MNRKLLRQWPRLTWLFALGFVGAIALLVVSPEPTPAEADYGHSEAPRVYQNVVGLPDSEDSTLLFQRFMLKTRFPVAL